MPSSLRGRIHDLLDLSLAAIRPKSAREVLVLFHPSAIARAQMMPIEQSLRGTSYHSRRWRSDHLTRIPRLDRPRDRARIAFLQVDWEVNGEMLAPWIARLREAHRGVKVVFLDWYAPLHVKQPDVLPLVDVYVKKQLLADPEPYFRGMLDTNLIEYESRWNPRFAEVKRLVVDRTQFERKVVTGWNFATHPPLIRELLRRHDPAAERPVDLHCRIAAPPRRDDWYSHMRGRSFDAAAGLAATLGSSHRVLVDRVRVTPKQYFAELRQSKMCFSPFGYGEVCWRDFEAIASGSLLVKPDMAHVLTDPSIYVPHETYVPVRWDFEDLEEVVRRYLRDPAQRVRISRNAAAAWEEFLRRGWSRAWTRVLERAGVDLGAAGSLI